MSRLRNRMTKAEFWTDPDLLSWTRDKRFFYMGLRSAAEDSGCIEDSPFGWMLVLYPSPRDRDISLEQVTSWRDELIADGKLIRYLANGKPYLYQTTFHDHEHPRNPQSPSLPLPPWVSWVDNPKDARKGRYEIDPVLLPAPILASTTAEQPLYDPCTSPPAQSSPVQPSPARVSKPLSEEDRSDECLDLCIHDDFEDFWAVYPRKEDKITARSRWKKVRPADRQLAIGVATIMSRLLADGIGPEKQYIKGPASWILKRRWEDWREGVPAAWCPENGNGKAEAARLEHDAFLRQFAAERGLDYEPEEDPCI